jgi:hypothetical protein
MRPLEEVKPQFVDHFLKRSEMQLLQVGFLGERQVL